MVQHKEVPMTHQSSRTKGQKKRRKKGWKQNPNGRGGRLEALKKKEGRK